MPRYIFICLASIKLVGLIGLSNAAVLVESRVTSITANGPEINVLIRNSGNEPIDFSLEATKWGVPADDGFPYCKPRSNPSPIIDLDQFTVVPFREKLGTGGVISARSWTHRMVIPLDASFELPCRVPLIVRLWTKEGHQDVWSKQFLLPVKSERDAVSMQSTAKLRFSSVVEADIQSDHLLVRSLIENTGVVAERLWISDRRIDCGNDARADWSTRYPVPQGADIGPITIPANGWGVFVSSVRLVQGQSFAGCMARIQFSRNYRTSEGDKPEWIVEKTVDVSLKQSGIFRLFPFQ